MLVDLTETFNPPSRAFQADGGSVVFPFYLTSEVSPL